MFGVSRKLHRVCRALRVAFGSTRAIDVEHLARMTLGDRSLEREVLHLFDLQSSMLVERMRHGPAAAIGTSAHTLKGSARGIGAWRIARRGRAGGTECRRLGSGPRRRRGRAGALGRGSPDGDRPAARRTTEPLLSADCPDPFLQRRSCKDMSAALRRRRADPLARQRSTRYRSGADPCQPASARISCPKSPISTTKARPAPSTPRSARP